MLVRVQKARLRPLRGSSPRPPNKTHLLVLPRGSKPWFPLVRVCPTAASVVRIAAFLFLLGHYGASEAKNCHMDGVAPRGTTVGSGWSGASHEYTGGVWLGLQEGLLLSITSATIHFFADQKGAYLVLNRRLLFYAQKRIRGCSSRKLGKYPKPWRPSLILKKALRLSANASMELLCSHTSSSCFSSP